MSIELERVPAIVAIASRAELAVQSGGSWMPTEAGTDWLLLSSGARWARVASGWFDRLPDDIRDLLPDDCRQAFDAAAKNEEKWFSKWGDESDSTCRHEPVIDKAIVPYSRA